MSKSARRSSSINEPGPAPAAGLPPAFTNPVDKPTTLLAASSQSYVTLLAARALAGAFSGVLSAIVYAIVSDLIPESRRGAALAAAFLMSMMSGRFVPAMALITSSVTPRLRGSFMSFNASIQQLASGTASFGASLLIGRNAAGELTHYGSVGILAVIATLASIHLARRIRAAPG